MTYEELCLEMPSLFPTLEWSILKMTGVISIMGELQPVHVRYAATLGEQFTDTFRQYMAETVDELHSLLHKCAHNVVRLHRVPNQDDDETKEPA